MLVAAQLFPENLFKTYKTFDEENFSTYLFYY